MSALLLTCDALTESGGAFLSSGTTPWGDGTANAAKLQWDSDKVRQDGTVTLSFTGGFGLRGRLLTPSPSAAR